MSKLLNGEKVFVSNNIKGVSKDQVITLIAALGGTTVSEKQVKTSSLCILDEDSDQKIIKELKKITKNPPRLVKLHYLLDGILRMKLDNEEH